MTKRALEHLVLGVLTSAALVALPAKARLQAQNPQQQVQQDPASQHRHDDDDDDDDDDRGRHPDHPIMRVPSGQFVTPTAIRGSVQQFLNPGLSAYPNFVAGEAVRSQLSPDGTTLAIVPGIVVRRSGNVVRSASLSGIPSTIPPIESHRE